MKAPPKRTMVLWRFEGAFDPGRVEREEWVLEFLDDIDDDEEEGDAQEDGEADAEAADHGLFVGGDPLRFEGDVEEVVESEDSLQEDEKGESNEVFDHGREVRSRRGNSKTLITSLVWESAIPLSTV